MTPGGPMGALSNPDDPVQHATALVWERLEALRAYHAVDELPSGASTEWDFLMAAYANLIAAVNAGDAESWAELAPYSSRRGAR